MSLQLANITESSVCYFWPEGIDGCAVGSTLWGHDWSRASCGDPRTEGTTAVGSPGGPWWVVVEALAAVASCTGASCRRVGP